MKKILILSLMLFWITSSPALAQKTSSSIHAQANKAWPAFWRQFSAALKRKDRVAWKRLIAPEREFFSGGGGETRDE